MSIAAELARLRGASARLTASQVPSLLGDDSRAVASGLPRDVVAGAARNALDALCAADPALEELAAPLLLLDPRADRATLPAADHDRLRAAVAELALRLGPALALRPAQKLLEWVVGPLETGARGSADELDALLVAALPFHATEQFPRLVRALLRPRGNLDMGMWTWLAPVVAQGRPGDAEFVLSEAPGAVLRRAIKFAADSAVAGVLNYPATAFVGKIVAQRVAGPACHGRANARKSTAIAMADQRLLLLQAITTLDRMCKVLTELPSGVSERAAEKDNGTVGTPDIEMNGELPKNSNMSNASSAERIRKSLSEVCAACLVVMTAGVVSLGPNDADLCDVVIKGACSLLVHSRAPEILLKPALWCVLTSVRAGQLEKLPDDVFRALALWDRLFDFLSDGPDAVAIEMGFRAFGMSAVHCVLASAPHPALDSFAFLKNVMSAQDALLSSSIVTELVLALLDGLSVRNQLDAASGDKIVSDIAACQDDASSKRFVEISNALAKILSPLARGRHAEAVDRAIRSHFATRKHGTKFAHRYRLVDDVLAQALCNTPFAIVKSAITDSDKTAGGHDTGVLVAGTLTASLDHPEACVRSAAIKHLSHPSFKLHGDTAANETNGIGNALLRRISVDTVISIAAATIESDVLLQFCAVDDVIDACAQRLLSFLRPDTLSGRRLKQETNILLAALKMFLCLVAGKDISRVQKLRMLALLVTLSANNSLALEQKSILRELTKFLPAVGDIGDCLVKDLGVSTRNDRNDARAKDPTSKEACDEDDEELPRRALANAVVSLKQVDDDVVDLLFAVYTWDKLCGLRLLSAALLWNCEVTDRFVTRVLLAGIDMLNCTMETNGAARVAGLDAVGSALKALQRTKNPDSQFCDLVPHLAEVWSCVFVADELDHLEEALSVVACRGGPEAVPLFLQDRIWSPQSEANRESRALALEMLGGFGLALRWPIEGFAVDLISALYGSDVQLRDSAVRLVCAMDESLRAGTNHAHDKLSRDSNEFYKVQCLLSILVTSAPISSSPPCGTYEIANIPSWNDQDIPPALQKFIAPQFEGVTYRPHDVKLARDSRPVLYAIMTNACEKRSWPVVASVLRGFSFLATSEPNIDDFLIACGLLNRLTRQLELDLAVNHSAVESVVRAFVPILSIPFLELQDSRVDEGITNMLVFLLNISKTVSTVELSQAKETCEQSDAIPEAEARSAVGQMIVSVLVRIAILSSEAHTERPTEETLAGRKLEVEGLDHFLHRWRNRIVDALLLTASSGSSCGDLISKLLRSSKGLLSSLDCQRALQQLRSTLPMFGSPQKADFIHAKTSPASSHGGVAVLETMLSLQVASRDINSSRNLGTMNQLESFVSACPLVWSFTNDVMSLTESNPESVTDDIKYQLQLALSALAVVMSRSEDSSFDMKDREIGRAENHLSSDQLQLVINAVSYPSWDHSESVSELDKSIRRSAIDLVKVFAMSPGANIHESVFPVLYKLAKSCNQPSSMSVVKTLIPALVANGVKPLRFVPLIVTGAFSAEAVNSGTNMESFQLDIISCAVNACKDTSEALGLAIRELCRTSGNQGYSAGKNSRTGRGPNAELWRTSSVISSMCSRLISLCGMDAPKQISAIAGADTIHIPSLVVQHFASPRFLRDVQHANRLEEDNEDSNGELSIAFIGLYEALLRSEDGGDSVQDRALGMLFSTASVDALSRCIRDSASDKTPIQTMRSLKVLSQRLDVSDLPFSLERRNAARAKLNFVNEVGTTLISLVTAGGFEKSGFPEEPVENFEVKQMALSVLEKLNRTLGCANRPAMLSCMKALSTLLRSEELCKVIDAPHSNRNAAAFAASIALCMASFVETLGTAVASFVPALVSLSVSIVGSALNPLSQSSEGGNVDGFDADEARRASRKLKREGDPVNHRAGASDANDETSLTVARGEATERLPQSSMHLLTMIAESGLRTCETVLDLLPNFFGQANFARLAVLSSSKNVKMLDTILTKAAVTVKASFILSAVAAALNSCEGRAGTDRGIVLMMHVLEKKINAMKKSEVKTLRHEILALCLRGLDYRAQLISQNFECNIANIPVQAIQDVEQATALTVLSFVLRLPEIDFQPLFNKILEWTESDIIHGNMERFMTEASPQVSPNLLRAKPAYVVMATLFDSLRALFVPYFTQVLDRTLSIIVTKPNDSFGGSPSMKETHASTKKRRRGSVVAEDAGREHKRVDFLVTQQRDLIDTCLVCISQFLRRAPEDVVMSSTVIRQILEGLLKSFDNASRMANHRLLDAFCALGSRIVTIGALDNSREESRQLLSALSRGILLRTRNEDSHVRAIACDAVRRVAVAVGEEYLVALPEAMPFLADLVDDENEIVEANARKLIHVLESFSGEPILEQLRS